MHARSLIRQIKPGFIEDAIAEYRNNVLPTANVCRGCRGVIGFVDRSTGKFLSITLWETEADMLMGERSRYLQQQIDRMAPYCSGAPITERFEVAAATPTIVAL